MPCRSSAVCSLRPEPPLPVKTGGTTGVPNELIGLISRFNKKVGEVVVVVVLALVVAVVAALVNIHQVRGLNLI